MLLFKRYYQKNLVLKGSNLVKLSYRTRLCDIKNDANYYYLQNIIYITPIDMNKYIIIWRFIPKFLQNIIKYLYMKWTVPYEICKTIQFTWIKSWTIIIWKKIDFGYWTTITWEWLELWDYTSLWYNNIFYTKKDFCVKMWKFCTTANDVSFIAAMNHNYNCLTTHTRSFKSLEFENIWWDIIIWNDVRIWKNAIIMKWVNIWTWAVIWAWSVVTKDIPPYAIAVWNPAKIVKYRFDEKTIKILLESKWWNRNIEKIQKNYNLEFINEYKD
jgi:acetyltransferase-like isoleucine patch superfamily enzyme